MTWSLDQVLLACGAVIFIGAFFFALIVGTIKSWNKDTENSKPKITLESLNERIKALEDGKVKKD